MNPSKVSLEATAGAIAGPWQPQELVRLNGNALTVAQFKGEFLWHHHEESDELFWCVEGKALIEWRGGKVELRPGEMIVIPKGMEHRTSSLEGAKVVMLAQEGQRNTGNIEHPTLTRSAQRAEED